MQANKGGVQRHTDGGNTAAKRGWDEIYVGGVNLQVENI